MPKIGSQITEQKLKDDSVTSAKIKDDEIVNADVNSAAAIAYSKLATDPRICRIKTGTYTGDGTESQAITGVGFQPGLLLIFQGVTTTDNAMINFFKTEDFATDGALRDMAAYHKFYTNMIKSLDSDGFTVSDYGGDIPPNKDGETYYYVAFG